MNNIWILRVLSFFLALVLYFFVHNQSNTSEISLLVPVELQNLPDQAVVLLPETRQVKVTLRGPSFLMSDLVSRPPSFKMKLPEGVENRYELSLKPEALAINSALQVVSIDPAKLELVMDKLQERMLPIEVPRIGSVPENFRLVSILVDPPRVLVSGAATELQTIKGIETYPIDLRSLTENATREISIRNPGKYTKLALDRVRVDITVESLAEEKVFENIPVKIIGKLPAGQKLAQQSVAVEVSGLKNKVEQITASQISASVDLAQLSENRRRVNVQIDLPDGVSLVLVEPSSIRLLE